jgi:hypothetical protein
MRNKKVLFVGGTGFIGFHLIKKCLRCNMSVTSISRTKPSKLLRLNKVFYKTCNLSNLRNLKKIIRNYFDFVVNLGGNIDHINKDKTYRSHCLGYYLQWVPQEAFYYSVENSQFLTRPFRTAGTYSKYNGIDDKMDNLHFYTTFIKFGIGRANYDAAQEIRNKHLTRENAKLLVKKYDGEFPERYF